MFNSSPKVVLRSKPGLKLANAFGVNLGFAGLSPVKLIQKVILNSNKRHIYRELNENNR